ncbi:MAG: MFS transporter [Thermicanus sp.]|nr:MFS transporter [Thermicanus sp.]
MKKKMGIIMGILITTFTGFGMIIPVMPVLISETVGDPATSSSAPFHLGMLLALYSAVSFFLSPIWGRLSDRYGRRPIILTGLIGFGVSFLLFGLSSGNLFLMYLSRILGGFFSGATTASAVAYVADITTDEERTKYMGLVGMSIGLGFILGPAVGGIAGHLDAAIPFFIAAGLSFVTFLFAISYLSESLTAARRMELAGERTSRWAAFTGPSKYLYILSFFVTFTLAGLESTLQYFEAIKIKAGTLDIGIMFMINGVVGAFIQGGVVRRIKKGSEPRFILLGLLLSALGFTLINFSMDFWTATLFVAIFGTGNALLRPNVTSLITQKTTVGQGVASGLNSSMDSLGRIVGPLLGSTLFSINIYYPYISGALLSILAIGLLYGFLASDRRVNEIKTA